MILSSRPSIRPSRAARLPQRANLSLPSTCRPLICHLSWVTGGALGVFLPAAEVHPRRSTSRARNGAASKSCGSPARGERGDESPAALLEPCSSFDADRRVSFMRAMPCNRNHSGTFCFLPSAGRHKTARSTRPRVRASTCIAYSLFSLEGEPEEHPERGLGPGGCPEQSQPGVVQSSARHAWGKQAPSWE